MTEKKAFELKKEADSDMSTSIFKWKPNYDEAATKYEKAGQMFRSLKNFDQAKDCYSKAANAYSNSKSLYMGGKNYEDAGNVCREQKKITEACDFYEKAAELYQKAGKVDKASQTLSKAAGLLPSEEKTKAISLFKKSIDLYNMNNSHHLATDTYRAFNAYLIKAGLFNEVIENLEKQLKSFEALEQKHNIHKAIISMIIIHLKCNEWVKATEVQEKHLEGSLGYGQSDEYYIAQDLLDSFENNDEDRLIKTIKSSKIKLLENQIAKVALSLKIIPGEMVIDSSVKKSKEKKKNDLFGSDDELGDFSEEENNQEEEEGELDVFDENNLA
eukprot:gene6750-10915_t